ncbi:putative leader peptide [Actinocorallia aurea]
MGDDRPMSSPLLVGRPHVDLRRQASCLCRRR